MRQGDYLQDSCQLAIRGQQPHCTPAPPAKSLQPAHFLFFQDSAPWAPTERDGTAGTSPPTLTFADTAVYLAWRREDDMRKAALSLAGVIALAIVAQAAEFHVAVDGKDSNPGTRAAPLRTIQRAADLAQPGDVITVHEGVLPRAHQPAARRRVRREAHRLSGRAGREGRDQGVGSRQELGEGPGRRLEGDAPQFVLRRLQSLQRPHPRRLVRSQGPGRITPARSISTATG